LLPQNLTNGEQLETALVADVLTYTTIRPQLSLQGNKPHENFSAKPLTINAYKTHFYEQKTLIISAN
jgi:hypothetical protein